MTHHPSDLVRDDVGSTLHKRPLTPAHTQTGQTAQRRRPSPPELTRCEARLLASWETALAFGWWRPRGSFPIPSAGISEPIFML